jgi:large subunit ribosomal protein L13
MKQKTYFAKPENIKIKWYIVDAKGKTLGRLATGIATILQGKHSPRYTPNVDMGYRVAVINAEKVTVTGRKQEEKFYYRHSGYFGGLTATKFSDMLKKKPEYIIQHAVKGMIPHNKLGDKLNRRLRVYRGPNHPHQAQEPEVIEI